MEDIFKSIKAYLYDRAASPLLGSFIVSWFVWNYRFFVILISAGYPTPEDKFSALDSLFSNFDISICDLSFQISGELVHGIVVPSAIAIGYLYIYPYLANPVYEHSLRKQKHLREIKQREENQRLLSAEESRELYRRLTDMQVKHETETDQLTKQISALNQTIEELERREFHDANDAEAPSEDPRFDNVNDADPEEFDSFIRAQIESRDDGEFLLADLFEKERWRELYPVLKQNIGKRLKEKVSRGDFVGVSAVRKGSGGQQVYEKRTRNSKPA